MFYFQCVKFGCIKFPSGSVKLSNIYLDIKGKVKTGNKKTVHLTLYNFIYFIC